MVVRTKSPRIAAARREALEEILRGHPADCGTCIKYLNCELQSLKQYIAEEEYRPKGPARLFAVDNGNPLFTLDPNKCVMCRRCLRACRELRGVGILVEKITPDGIPYIGTEGDLPLARAGCRFCGACAEVCPSGAIMDKEELTRGRNRKTALLPCRYTCPAEIDVPSYLRFIREKDYPSALAVIREKVPFPAVLGYVCDHPCETGCRRGLVNAPVAIRQLKRYVAQAAPPRAGNTPAPPTGKKVAVVGAGPAGLTAAYFLARKGHDVTVYEAMSEAGGMLRYGIPEYRLPRDILRKEIADIGSAGVRIVTGARITSLDGLTGQGYDSIIVAIGTHRGQKLNIPGTESPGVLIGVDFLREVNSGIPVTVGRDVLVLGGGNVAFDCARVARRLGATVKLACLESRNTMPAAEDEIEQGEEEGITIYPSRTFRRILTENGKITGVECLEVSALSFDEEKNPQIEVREGSEHVLSADTVIIAIGQRPDIPEGFGLEGTSGGTIAIDAYSPAAGREGVFACGDAVTGTSSVIRAIASGRKAASAVDSYLGGNGSIDEIGVPTRDFPKTLGRCEGFAFLERCAEARLAPGERLKGFGCVVTGIDEATALNEAGRCLQCDLRLKITPVKFWSSYQ
ncbi:MAG: FAD-dependent oxidoreductase [Dehalococcoidales bacterium]|nr:FAD-dependent oxidoreductase [Dehalococcoidales bacterium]